MPYIKKAQYDALTMAGAMMSNICFNGKQSASLPEQYRADMKECQEAWDKALREVRCKPERELRGMITRMKRKGSPC